MTDRLASKISHSMELIKKYETGGKLTQEQLDNEICSLWEWILFFQHERLIHLLVTLLFAILTFASLSLFLLTDFLPMTAAFALFLILLVPYIFHYYRLENGVQKLYGLYDQVKALREDKNG